MSSQSRYGSVGLVKCNWNSYRVVLMSSNWKTTLNIPLLWFILLMFLLCYWTYSRATPGRLLCQHSDNSDVSASIFHITPRHPVEGQLCPPHNGWVSVLHDTLPPPKKRTTYSNNKSVSLNDTLHWQITQSKYLVYYIHIMALCFFYFHGNRQLFQHIRSCYYVRKKEEILSHTSC